jgi:hypothetical protein
MLAPNNKAVDAFKEWKQKNTNEAIDAMVRNNMQEERIINIENSLFQVSDNIFFVDNNESIFNSHLYAPFKIIVNHLYDTFWSNLLVIWLMTITLCLTLYFNFFARIIKLTGKSLGIIGSSKPKKYV